ncbi:hypothetical protein LCGC14_1956690 [marine sediment metagenome]|uniref:Uncharacterized protein n=1 Tax=marine sediment metagenome TaxID=412755 RepID=A0A0F9HUA2_9ZZZZ
MKRIGGEEMPEKVFSIPALLAAAEEGRREGKVAVIRWLRRNSKYKVMQKTASGKYYENLLERDWLELSDVALLPNEEERT